MRSVIKSFIFFGMMLLMTACGQQLSIADLYELKDCSGPCYKQMPCEGQEVEVKVLLNGRNVLRSGNISFMRMPDDIDKSIKVEFADDVPEEVKGSLEKNAGKSVILSGRLEGYDLLTPTSCQRGHMIFIRSENDIRYE